MSGTELRTLQAGSLNPHCCLMQATFCGSEKLSGLLRIYTANKWQSWDSNSYLSDSKVFTFLPLLLWQNLRREKQGRRTPGPGGGKNVAPLQKEPLPEMGLPSRVRILKLHPRARFLLLAPGCGQACWCRQEPSPCLG